MREGVRDGKREGFGFVASRQYIRMLPQDAMTR